MAPAAHHIEAGLTARAGGADPAPARILSVNLGSAAPSSHPDIALTGIDKRPVTYPVLVRDPGPRGTGASGVVGDSVIDLRHHGGTDQAVYAYAREDLDAFESALGRELACGSFGENLTTAGLDVTGALIGERWRIGAQCILEVSAPRVPCRTFAGWLHERAWIARFTARGAPGAYLRVAVEGMVQAGDTVQVLNRPPHEVTIGACFAAMTLEPERLGDLLAARAWLPVAITRRVERAQRRFLATEQRPATRS